MATKTKTTNLIRLKCERCGRVNYYLWKKKTAEYKLKLNKYCKWCRKHTLHKESKK